MRRTALVAAVCLAALVPAAGYAQSTFGAVVGSVSDSTGAVLPGVAVVVRNDRTAVEREVTTDARGDFQVANVDAGLYTVIFSLSGFGERRLPAEVLARQTVRVDARLTVAGTSERVEVRAAAPVIETERATIDSSKSGDEISKLALNFRATNNTSPIVVATLAQGVQQDRGGQISVAGTLPFMTSFSVDGISTQRTRGGGPSRELFPSVESIEEFKVSAANNNAEFMQVTDITTTTKSGSNQPHGTVFWFGQDSKFSSTDRFAPKDPSGNPIKPKVNANSFGGSSGGPIVRNRTFYFATYEGVRRPNETTLSQIVPPDAFRIGDLSSVSAALRNPFTGGAYAGNRIPVNPASAAILDTLYEHQNQSTGAATNAPNFILNAPGDYRVNGLDLRIDENFSGSQKLFGRLTVKNVDTSGATGSFNTKQGDPFADTAVRQLALAENAILGPHLLNELRGGFSFTRETSGYPLAAKGADLIRQYGFSNLPPTPASGGIPSFEFSDTFIASGGAKPRDVLSRTYQFSDAVTWIRGSHTLKGGADVQRVEYKDQVTFFNGEDYGRYFFDGSFTGNAFADFLLGLPAFTSYAQNAPDVSPYATHFAAFVQDDWRPTPTVTINYGVRYDLRPPMNDRSNQLGNFDRDFPGGRVIVANTAQLAQVPAALRASLPNTPFVTAAEAGLPETLRYTDKNNVNPRLGVAWRPTGRTVLRGGIGSYTVPLYGSINYSLAGVVTSDVPVFQNAAVPGGYAIQFPNVFPSALRATPGAGTQDFRRANQFDLQDPRTVQWTLTVDHDLGGRVGVRVSYVGSRTNDLVWSPDLNQIRANTLGYAAVRDTRPFKDWNVVTTRDNGAKARYHSLGVEVTKRFSQGLQLNASYTLARNQSDAGGAVPGSFAAENGTTTLDRYRGDADFGNVPFTRRHRYVSTFLYQLPFGRGRALASQIGPGLDLLIGGWDIAGVALVQSGPFLTPSFSNADPSGTGAIVRGFTATQRPDCVGDGNLSNPTSDAYFDRNAFVRPASNIGRFGNCAVSSLIGPGTGVFSMTVGKSVPVMAPARLRFEVAFSNLFNVENLDTPGSLTITSSSFGRITATQPVDQAGPRTVQFSLRYSF
ncbi:MAG TPA: carboxypeptidase-like regulatory domain-containing protein [Vicinamibacterales bacterium]|nr:carboxypeptidase-like regulatory domain-containing protein [Vicinamibacterales bacterium]